MPSHLTRWRRWAPWAMATGGLLLAGALVGGGCAGDPLGMRTQSAGIYPPPPQPPRVVALGTLRGAPAPTKTEVELSLLLFGAEPPPPLTLANPAALAAGPQGIYVCDAALDTVFRWEPADQALGELTLTPPTDHPNAIDLAPTGELILCDYGGVRRISADGRTLQHYRLPEGAYRPSSALRVGAEVWVANLAQHRLEIFDADTGAYLRPLGEHGKEPGQFGLPRSLARGPDDTVLVVDLLNCRVQVLAQDGTWVRNIGRAGDVVGTFGRPKDVAVGPDGVIFVSDAFLQRVHAFTPEGVPLLAFGDPGSGPGELTMPSGLAIASTVPLRELPPPPVAETPAYYVLVGEQLHHAGVRVYAWLPSREEVLAVALPTGESRAPWVPAFPESVAINPHWHADRCDTCHKVAGGQLQPIPLDETDALCLACHDGIKAPADPHPIGRPLDTELVDTPEGWPAINGGIGCMTCHDITGHCHPNPRRPVVNAVLLRGFDVQRPLEYCSNCHKADLGGRFSPHLQRDPSGKIREDACFFCHTVLPHVPEDGRRQFEPHLRVDTSELCLNCHAPHWDLSPLGHVDRPVTPRIRQWMLMREFARQTQAPPAQLAAMALTTTRGPAHLPLGRGDTVTCYTCHNPHYAGLFPAGSELGALAGSSEDRRAALRTDWIDLCSECHHH